MQQLANPRLTKNMLKKRRHRNNQIQKLLERDGDKCWLCKNPLNGDYSLDHVKCHSDGGKKILENLRLTHTKCNNQRPNPTHAELEEIKLEIRNNQYNHFEEFLTTLL
jgi:5-methylcytosine-specific restriction endonuclease McrA